LQPNFIFDYIFSFCISFTIECIGEGVVKALCFGKFREISKVLGHNALTTTPSLAQSNSGHNPHRWFSLTHDTCVSAISYTIKLVHVKNYVEMNGNPTNKKRGFSP